MMTAKSQKVKVSRVALDRAITEATLAAETTAGWHCVHQR